MAFPNVGSSIAMSQVNTELGASSTSTLTMNNINLRKWFRRPLGVVFSTKSPELGSGGASWPPSGWTVKWNSPVNGNLYNSSIYNSTPFPIWTRDGGYYGFYYNTNGTISFNNTSGGTTYTFVNYQTKIAMGVNGMSLQRMAAKTGANNSYYKVRFEGTYNSSTGTAGSPNVVVEVTFFNPDLTAGSLVAEIVTGECANSGNNLYYDDGRWVKWINGATLSANQSYVIYSNISGTSPFLYSGSYFSSGSTPSVSLNDGRGKAKYLTYDSYIESVCSGSANHDIWHKVHDGIGGTFGYEIEVNACDCGGTGPSYGTATGYTDCDGGAGNYRVERYDGNCGTYFDIDYNSCTYCAGQGAHGNGAGTLAYEYCSNGNKGQMLYYNNYNCDVYDGGIVTYNTCECPGGTDNHSPCDELVNDCLYNFTYDANVDHAVVYWCSCNDSSHTVIVENSTYCGGSGPGGYASCPC